MGAFGIGEEYTVFIADAGTTPSTPTDPENMASCWEIGELPDAATFNRVRAMIERYDRNSPGQTLVHPGRRKATASFTLNVDKAGNTGFTRLVGAYESNTDGFVSGGNLIYLIFSNGTASDWLAHGTAGVAALNYDLGNQNIIQASLEVEFNGDPTVTVHA